MTPFAPIPTSHIRSYVRQLRENMRFYRKRGDREQSKYYLKSIHFWLIELRIRSERQCL